MYQNGNYGLTEGLAGQRSWYQRVDMIQERSPASYRKPDGVQGRGATDRSAQKPMVIPQTSIAKTRHHFIPIPAFTRDAVLVWVESARSEYSQPVVGDRCSK